MVVNISEGVVDNVSSLISQITFLNTIVQFLGGIVVVYSIYLAISLIWQRKRNKEITEIKEMIKKIEKKVDKL